MTLFLANHRLPFNAFSLVALCAVYNEHNDGDVCCVARHTIIRNKFYQLTLINSQLLNAQFKLQLKVTKDNK